MATNPLNGNQAPKHPIELVIKIGGEDWEYVSRILSQMARDAERGELICGCGGGAGGSYSIHSEFRSVTPEQFRKELSEWCDSTRSSQAGGPAAD